MSLSSTTLKEKVADLYGLQGDTTAEATAVKALDEAISEMNMEMWESLLSEQTGIALTADQNYVTMPTAMYKEKQAWLVNTVDGTRTYPLAYVDWATFNRLYGPKRGTGFPSAYSTFGEEAKVYLGRIPDDAAANDYTITIQYYMRLRSATAAEADDQVLDVPNEWEVPLLHKARQFYALLIGGPGSPDIVIFQGLYDSAITNLREADRRHPDEVTRFRMYGGYSGFGRSRAGGIYTRID